MTEGNEGNEENEGNDRDEEYEGSEELIKFFDDFIEVMHNSRRMQTESEERCFFLSQISKESKMLEASHEETPMHYLCPRIDD